jgi:hypothetical protein
VVNKVLRQKLITCLLDPMELSFEDTAALANFNDVCLACKFGPFDIVARVRNATFPGVSENAYRILLEEYNPADTVEVVQRKKRLTTTFSRLLPSHSGLRHLKIGLYSSGLWNSSRMVVKAEPTREYMQGLDAQFILGLKELQTITITARNGHPGLCRIGLQKVITDAGSIEQLRPVSEFAQQIKDGFTEQGRDVRVEVHLKYGKDLEEQRVLH